MRSFEEIKSIEATVYKALRKHGELNLYYTPASLLIFKRKPAIVYITEPELHSLFSPYYHNYMSLTYLLEEIASHGLIRYAMGLDGTIKIELKKFKQVWQSYLKDIGMVFRAR
jgi:hypothetical protein